MKYHNAAKKKQEKPTAGGCNGMYEHSYAPTGYYMPVEPPLILYIYDEIGPEVDYVELVHALRYAADGQEVIIHINSPGGNLNSCLSIINAMKASQADITTIVDGEAASAGAMIWLAGQRKLIASRHVMVMLHGASCGYGYSKTSDIANTNAALLRLMEGVLDDLTAGFQNEEEREDIRKGVDVYLTGTDIVERLGLQAQDGEETVDNSQD